MFDHLLRLIKHIRRELQVDAGSIDVDKAVNAPAKPGSAVIFHCLTLHYSPPNTSDKSRRAMILTYQPSASNAGPNSRAEVVRGEVIPPAA
ncbi:MAG: hypothetical protein COZ56_08015 [Armatimonadetes bacterium CG_4_8_14_3_um_filter_58_9]|nr:MAG: hypothetical protein COZ56_08015 [Armatimonadetes bacterium CG_4_8_14_3_um_filter_58_9]PJB74767.1 MAG: hypothetical protein CO095_04455 [Armatimonadetes bacterium CG_4_9_14_3_um_filter_58_7]